MKRGHSKLSIYFVITLLCFLSSCGGGGDAPVGAPKTLSWDVPTQYMDGTSFDPVTTLKEYEIFVRQDTNFSPSDNYVVVSAVDPASHQLVNSFDLGLAYSGLSLSKGITYYAAMRVVMTDGERSDFSLPSPTFSF